MFYLLLALWGTTSLPALLPRERQMLTGVALLQLMALAAAAWALHTLEGETRGEGPAFATLVLLYGTFQIVMLLSFVGRGLADLLRRRLSGTSLRRMRRCLLALALLLPAAAVVLSGGYWAGPPPLVKLALLLALPLLWMAMALGLPGQAPAKPAAP